MVLDETVERLSIRLRADALLVGTGARSTQGEVAIREVLRMQGLAPEFVSDYAQVAKVDVVGRLFAEKPDLVQTVCVSDYLRPSPGPKGGMAPSVTRAGGAMAAYLHRFGIRHLLLAGLESSFGLAWMTFYRLHGDERFSAADAEYARYEVPAALYEWQCAHSTGVRGHRGAATHGPTRLAPREMQVAMLNVRGHAPKDIARQLGLSVHYVRDLIQGCRVKLGISGRRMTLDDLVSTDSATG